MLSINLTPPAFPLPPACIWAFRTNFSLFKFEVDGCQYGLGSEALQQGEFFKGSWSVVSSLATLGAQFQICRGPSHSHKHLHGKGSLEVHGLKSRASQLASNWPERFRELFVRNLCDALAA